MSLGSLSKKYESGSAGAGTIANNAGDWGGKSYGTYQIATNTGTMSSFMKYLSSHNKGMYNALKGKSIGSSSFDSAWKQLAAKYPKEFNAVQHEFIKGNNYQPSANKLKSSLGVNVDARSLALQNVIWSIGTQHGSGGALNIARNANINNRMSDKEIIERLYAERMKVNKYFSRSSAKIKQAVLNRFKQELKDALAMLSNQGTRKGGSQEA